MIKVAGRFDHFRLRPVRLLEEASKEGEVEVRALHTSEVPIEERRYVWTACRYVSRFEPVDRLEVGFEASEDLLSRVPDYVQEVSASGCRPKVIVTGCYDWLHSGHIRFFEEAASYGELTVVVGSDRNVGLLKGSRHPMFHENERRYLVGSIRHVHQALISTGEGWMDAAPEIELLKPDTYIVNEDGDKPEKKAFCAERGIEYKVLRREPAEGLVRRESTKLRGF